MAHNITIIHGDVLEKVGEAESTYGRFSAVMTDPPYGLSSSSIPTERIMVSWLGAQRDLPSVKGFKNKDWDGYIQPPSTWSAIRSACLPGAIMLMFSGSRTSDMASVSARIGGWERYDTIDHFAPSKVSWIQAEAMPKSLDLSKFADKRAGESGDVIQEIEYPDIRNGHDREYGSSIFGGEKTGTLSHKKRAPVSQHAIDFYGYGTALTPAHEDVILFRSPMDATYYDNLVENGTGALNIIDSVVGSDQYWSASDGYVTTNQRGRWPKNVVMTCECESDEHRPGCPEYELTEQAGYSTSRAAQRGAGINGNLFIAPKYESTERGINDSGSKARFFYVPKAQSAERTLGLAADRNPHPTVKPIRLAMYLARMILPPYPYRDNAVLFVPFCGSGSEIIGAALAGWKNIVGIEAEAEYVSVALQRVEAWLQTAERIGSNNPNEIIAAYK